MTSVETVSVLFTDLVGSTGLASRIGPAAAEELRREHFALLREAIEATSGREVKNVGDGLMVVFGSAAAAVDCAVQMQQRVEHRNRRAEDQLGVRIGISLGDADCEEDDYFGPPVVESARLCNAAGGGQILTVELVRMMVGGRGSHSFSAVGVLELKGIPEPVAALEVEWEPAGAEANPIALPPRLRQMPPVGYVGRVAERERLGAMWADARRGSVRLAFLSGEPGIGKTRLSTHLAIEAHGEGATVLYGCSQEDLRVPYQPWVEAIRHYVEAAPEPTLQGHVERHGGELTRLVPELTRRLEGVPDPRDTDPETERYLQYGAAVDLLEAASGDDPVIVILDDLHWSDKPTLSLLKHLLSSSLGRMLVIGTYRDSDITSGHPLSELLADLRREDGVERLSLTGLEQDDVVQLTEAAAGHDMDEMGRALAQEVARETDGNPFFVAEILRHLVESGAITRQESGRWALSGSLADLGLPESVREVIGRRVGRLGDEVKQVLGVASVIGRDFDADLLGRVVDQSDDELLDVLEAAVAASVLGESSETPGRFTFAHALINHTLYEELGTTRRARLHRRIAEALEAICGDDPGPRLGEMAHHWSAATAAVDPRKALEYTRRAGDRALAQLAPDEGVRWFTSALELLAGDPEAGAEERCDLLISLGESQRQAGEAEFRQTLLDASASAQKLGDGDRLVRAALANTRGFFSAAGLIDDERVEVLEAAVEAVREDDLSSRARLLALLANELVYAGDLERRTALCDEALQLARRASDESTIAYVGQFLYLAAGFPETLDYRLAVVEEAESAASGAGDPVREFWVGSVSGLCHMEAGRMEEADRSFELIRTIAEDVGQPTMRWIELFERSLRMFLAGDIEGSDELAERAVDLGTGSGEPDSLPIYVGQLVNLRYEQGRLDEIEDLIAQVTEDSPGLSSFRALLSLTHLELGREDEARAVIEPVAAGRFEAVPRDFLWLTTLCVYGEVAARLGMREAAEWLYDRLVPFAHQVGITGCSTWGAIDRYLGMLAGSLDRDEEAERHLASAAEVHERIRAPVFLARTRLDWAEMLLARDAVGDRDRERARALLGEALAGARERGATALERRAEAVLRAGSPTGA